MNAEVATRRLTVLHSHVLGLNRQESCASDIAMQVRGLHLLPVKALNSCCMLRSHSVLCALQPCAASSAIGYARPAACALPHGRVCTSEVRLKLDDGTRRAAAYGCVSAGRICRHELLAYAQGKGRHEEAALQAAEHVLGSTQIAVKGRTAAKV
jgi:hypothetical protein